MVRRERRAMFQAVVRGEVAVARGRRRRRRRRRRGGGERKRKRVFGVRI